MKAVSAKNWALPVIGGRRYSTGVPPEDEFFVDFSGLSDQNPLNPSQWLHGETDGGDWLDFQVLNGRACGGAYSSDPPPPYNDSIAILKPSAFACDSNQFAERVVYLTPGYTAPNKTHECGLFLRFTLSDGVASGYEAYWNVRGNFAVVRWNGALNSFNVLSGTGPGPGTPAHGDVFRFEAEGSTLRVLKNGVLVRTSTSTTFTTGQPGMQSYVDPTLDFSDYGFQSFRCGNIVA